MRVSGSMGADLLELVLTEARNMSTLAGRGLSRAEAKIPGRQREIPYRALWVSWWELCGPIPLAGSRWPLTRPWETRSQECRVRS